MIDEICGKLNEEPFWIVSNKFNNEFLSSQQCMNEWINK